MRDRPTSSFVEEVDRAPGHERSRVPDQLWDLDDAANFLKCSTRTVRELIRKDGLPCMRLRSRLRFDPHDVLCWAKWRGREDR